MSRRLALMIAVFAGGALLMATAFLQIATPASASDPPLSIAAGNGHSCAVTFETTVKCWGENSSGQLGNGGTDSSMVPVDVCETVFLAGSGAGGPPTCCPILTGESMPAGIPPTCTLGGILQVAAGYAHTCALTSAASVKCWGDNSVGQLGDGTNNERHRPVDVCAPGLAGTSTAGGASTCCVIVLGGAGDVLPQVPPTPCGALASITQITAGSGHTCALQDNGHVWCWGSNVFGQLGDGSNFERDYPVEVCSGAPLVLGAGGGFPCSPLSGVVAIDAGAVHTCALLDTGGVKCWGSNAEGQLGNNTTDDNVYPQSVCAEQTFIVAGGGPSCCLVFVTGAPSIQVPEPGCYLTGATAVTAGGDHSCALMNDATVLCWGYNEHGELGDGTHFQRTIPVHVCSELLIAGGGDPCCSIILGASSAGVPPPCPDLGNVESVVAGYRHTCAVITDGHMVCWGLGFSGQLGHGGTFDTSIPLAVCDKQPLISGVSPPCGELSDVAAVGGGTSHTCAIIDDKRIVCWGSNISGELGTGLPGGTYVPAEVVGFVSKNTPTATPTNTPTSTPTPMGPTNTPTNTPTVPAGATNTPTSPGGATNTPTRTNTPPAGGLLGDVNCDGTVNAIDAALILQLTAGIIGSVPCPQNADVDGNGSINPIDSALILQFTAGLIPSL